MPTVIDELIIKLGLDARGFQADAEKTQRTTTRVGAVARRESSELEESLRKTQVETGRRLKQTEEVGDRTHKSLSRTVKEVGALFGVLATGYGIQQFVKNLTSTEAATGRLAKNIGMSTAELNTWQEAAKRFGGSAEETGATFLGLSQELERMAITGQSEIKPYFLALGVALNDASGKVRPFRDIMLDLSDKFSKMPVQQANYFGRAIGFDQGTITLLREGRGAIEAVLAEVAKIGVITDKQSDEAIKFQNLMSSLEQSFNNLKRALLSELLPEINKAIKGLQNLMEEPATKAEILKALHDMGEGVREFAEFANAAAQAVGGWKNATEILFAIWVGSKFLKVLASLQALVGLLGAVGGGAAALPAWLGAYLGFKLGSNPIATDEQEREAMSHEGGPPLPRMGQERTVGDWMEEQWRRATGWAGGATVPSPGTGPTRGQRNNNPLNLSYMPGQIGVLGREEGGNHQFGVFPDMETGVAANMRQLLRYQENNGLNTVRQLVEKWTSEPGVDHTQYINDVARAIGVGPDTPIDLRQQQVAEAYIRAAALHESGAVSPEAVSKGVSMGLGNWARSAPPSMPSTPRPDISSLDPGLRYGMRTPAAAAYSPASATGAANSNTVNVGTVVVNTQATDASGIARDISGALRKYAFVNQANTGLA